MPLVLARLTSFLIISDLTQINFRRSVQERVLSNDLLAKGFCDYLKMIWKFLHFFWNFFPDLSQRVDAVKDENLKLKSENQV